MKNDITKAPAFHKIVLAAWLRRLGTNVPAVRRIKHTDRFGSRYSTYTPVCEPERHPFKAHAIYRRFAHIIDRYV